MTQLFVQLAQTVTGNVITIVSLELAAAIIGFVIAWYYARSVYTPVIKGLEADKTNLNDQVTSLKGELEKLNKKVNTLDEKINRLEQDLASKEKEIADLSAETIHVGKYEISHSRGGENYFNLKATNGQVILSSVMYSSADECANAIVSARESCTDDNMYERKISSNNKHFFNLKASTGHVIGMSEMYESLANMEKGIASVKRNGISTIIEKQYEE
jgi:uncharacterized protein YegP (UPF0339 family)